MTAAGVARRVFVVCEDGTEYIDRFRRFLGQSFDFVAAPDFAAARGLVAETDGLLLDLDFRRTPPERLVDEQGQSAAGVDAGTRARLAETQGILILRRLRAEGIVTPAVLFADLDDDAQAEFLRRTLAPLTLAPSRLGLRELAALLRGY
ncbi:MAG: hypothetical protein ACJ8F1_00720 [Polyangia bacterium]